MSNQYENKIRGTASDSGGARINNNGEGYAELTTHAQQKVQEADDQFWAIHGNYYLATTAAAGTGTASQASVAAYDGAKDVLQIVNTSTVYTLWMRYIRMFIEVVPGGSGTQKYEIGLDSAGTTARSANGTSLTNRRVNYNVDSIFSTLVTTIGAMTSVAQTATRALIYDGQIRNGVGLAGDVFMLTFGNMNESVTGYLDPATTVGQQKVIPHGHLAVPPGYALRMQHYGASLTTAATIQWAVAGIYR